MACLGGHSRREARYGEGILEHDDVDEPLEQHETILAVGVRIGELRMILGRSKTIMTSKQIKRFSRMGDDSNYSPPDIVTKERYFSVILHICHSFGIKYVSYRSPPPHNEIIEIRLNEKDKVDKVLDNFKQWDLAEVTVSEKSKGPQSLLEIRSWIDGNTTGGHSYSISHSVIIFERKEDAVLFKMACF